MDAVKPVSAATTTTTTRTSAVRPSWPRSLVNSPARKTLLAAGLTLALVAGTWKWNRDALRANELKQRAIAPWHVPVDRSGGGI